VRLYDLKIDWCKGCMVCRRTAECPLRDDLPALAKDICLADALIIGTPSYWGQPSAATKALFDRLVGYFATYSLVGRKFRISPHFKGQGKQAVVITACTAPSPWAELFGHSTGPLKLLRRMLRGGGIKVIGSLACKDTWRAPNAKEKWLGRAAALGREITVSEAKREPYSAPGS
jgi:FMN-dependent NADH-azoreductase